MAALRLPIESLLATGRVQRANALARRAPAAWGYAEVAGRFVEVTGDARLTIAAGLVLDAQRHAETVAWVAPPDSIVFPPDLAACGIDLDALLFVRPAGEEMALHALDELLRSGAFGLVVADGLSAKALGMAAQVRLAGAAQQHDAAFVVLRACGDGVSGDRGSLASLRLVSFRRRVEAGRFEIGFEATKDKRRGRSWTMVIGCEGVAGLG
ncbi:MAG: recombinase A [Planctomycetes bacterium]|nr:recombinase A [Planctomycetota bacterium]